jgi:hypothetical protein
MKQFGLKMQYPSDWYYDEKVGPIDDLPDRIFLVSFTSPPNNDATDVVFAWFTIEKLNNRITLEERKNTVYDNLNRFPEITQKIVQLCPIVQCVVRIRNGHRTEHGSLDIFINPNSCKARYKTIRDKIGNWQ